ncbi:MAG: CBS domain-containing protein [Haloarculaceae archaeon]
MLVEDVMQTDIVTVAVEGTLRDGVAQMLEHRVGSVIVTENGGPTGIVTETDALHAGYVTERPFDDIDIAAVMSEPLVTVEPTRTVRSAIQRMADEQLKKLPVLDGLDLVGILTMTDISRHYGDIVREIHEIARPRDSRADGW